MNTLFKLHIKAALAVTVLSTALWLPLAAQAQDSPGTTGHTPGMHMQMESQMHHQAMHIPIHAGGCRHSIEKSAHLPDAGNGRTGPGAGFAETDPANQFITGNTGETWSDEVSNQHILAGFGETDPAAITPLDNLAVSGVSTRRLQITQAGFAETDPAASTSRPGTDAEDRHPVICSC